MLKHLPINFSFFCFFSQSFGFYHDFTRIKAVNKPSQRLQGSKLLSKEDHLTEIFEITQIDRTLKATFFSPVLSNKGLDLLQASAKGRRAKD